MSGESLRHCCTTVIAPENLPAIATAHTPVPAGLPWRLQGNDFIGAADETGSFPASADSGSMRGLELALGRTSPWQSDSRAVSAMVRRGVFRLGDEVECTQPQRLHRNRAPSMPVAS